MSTAEMAELQQTVAGIATSVAALTTRLPPLVTEGVELQNSERSNTPDPDPLGPAEEPHSWLGRPREGRPREVDPVVLDFLQGHWGSEGRAERCSAALTSVPRPLLPFATVPEVNPEIKVLAKERSLHPEGGSQGPAKVTAWDQALGEGQDTVAAAMSPLVGLLEIGLSEEVIDRRTVAEHLGAATAHLGRLFASLSRERREGVIARVAPNLRQMEAHDGGDEGSPLLFREGFLGQLRTRNETIKVLREARQPPLPLRSQQQKGPAVRLPRGPAPRAGVEVAQYGTGGDTDPVSSGPSTSSPEDAPREPLRNSEDYKIILPTLPTGYVATNSVILHCDVKGRPYRIQDFRDELRRLEVLKDLASAGPHQMNHVWMLRLHTLQAKQRLVDAKELTVKGGRCLVLDPSNVVVKLKLHWVPYDVPNCQVKKEMERYGKVSDVTRDFFREKGFEAVESNTRSDGPRCVLDAGGRGTSNETAASRATVRYGHETDDCVKTYASIARDRKSEDNSDYVMDDAEAEEAVGGSPPAGLTRTEPSGASKPDDDGDPDAATPSQDPEARVQVQVMAVDADARASRRTKVQLPESGPLLQKPKKIRTMTTPPVVVVPVAPRTPTPFLGEIYEDVEDWINQYERAARDNGWSDERRLCRSFTRI
ncbi:hypothetical protein HPB47_019253 [Ixodes persulcatus]|uniref:Uncharacterized protein n=1 Tax=Ixodes persulcatus TaxID=34615 RepID=A0AC60QJH4_IXOPE|nr:hypothetical protein HPB47_019253 [Ixodes persulcatus]